MVGIYKIINNLNNKIYVGSSIDIENRWIQHKKSLISGNHHSIKLQRSYKKYGEDAFSFLIIEECTLDLLIIREQYYIDILDSYKNGYNSTPIAGIGFNTGMKHTEETKEKLKNAALKQFKEKGHPLLGKHVSEETKEKIREKLKGQKLSDETKKKMSESRKGRKMSTESVEKTRQSNIGRKASDETKRKMSDAKLGKKQSIEIIEHRVKLNTGKKRTEEQKKRMSEGMKGIKKGPLSEERKEKLSKVNSKKIAHINDIGDTIKEYNSIKECSIDLNIDHRRISDVLCGRKESYKDNKFIYL